MSWKKILRKGDTEEMEALWGMRSDEIIGRFGQQDADEAEIISVVANNVIEDNNIKITDKMTEEEVKELLKPHLARLSEYNPNVDPDEYIDADIVEYWFSYEFKNWLEEHLE